MIMNIQIPRTNQKRIVIIGGGFGGLTLADKLKKQNFQIVLIDRNNYHQFQPLLYQVASSGLESSSISFPYRKQFRKRKNFFFRLAEVHAVNTEKNEVETSIGNLIYDYLVIAAGSTTNFHGNDIIRQWSFPMKSVEEALTLRNYLLLNLEWALDCDNDKTRQKLLNVVIVGGGATGVEIAGAISEMKRYIIPNDYPDLKGVDEINIYLIERSDRILSAFSKESSDHALRFLKKMGVTVILNKTVTGFENNYVLLDDGQRIGTNSLIWVSGVKAEHIDRINTESIGRGGRILVNKFNQVSGYTNVFAIGDICLQPEKNYPNGHPQLAPVAIQQGKHLARNFKRQLKKKEWKPFLYTDKGTLATIGRNKAVAEIRNIKLYGFPAWVVWLLVHLRSILGVKNKVLVLLDWMWNYITYDQSVRFILFVKPRKRMKMDDKLK